MTEVAIRQEQQVAAPAASETTAVISMIERAARDPQVDIDKMERLMLMQERAMDRRAKAAYASALSLMQPELPSVKERGGIKDRGGNIQSTYALWEDINDAIKPVLSRHGFAISFRVEHPANGIAVTGVLSHEDGHSEQTTIVLPHDTSGSKNAVQAVGSSVSYGKRYTASALLNLTSHGEDDDGKAAGRAEKTISEEQEMELREMIEAAEASEPGLKTYFKVEHLRDLKADRYGEAKSMLQRKIQSKGQR
jgi:hypothetical protein